MSAATITFGEQVENHVGMQQIGQLANAGFSIDDLQSMKKRFSKAGAVCEWVDLKQGLPEELRDEATDASVLVIRDAVDILLADIGKTCNDLFDEQFDLPHDTQVFMYGRVVQKRARWNLCFSDQPQDPNYEEKQGRIIAFSDVPLTSFIREALGKFLGKKGEMLQAEGNYYYDIEKCGIGWHGDAERKIVVGVRLGEPIPLYYQWYRDSKRVGEKIKLKLFGGDIYVMSEKATGFDWKKKKILTLRHAAGCEKYVK